MRRSKTNITIIGTRAVALGTLSAGMMFAGRAGAYDFAPPPPGMPTGTFNTFQLYVADQATYDDNLFRVPLGTAGVPGAIYPNSSQSDFADTATVGTQGRWDIGRQEVELNVRADENRFARNDRLDFVSGNSVATWNWRAGEYFSGQLQALYDRSLASFSETRFLGKDLVTSVEELGYARYQAGPHWAAYGQVRGSYTDHSAPLAQFNDFHNKAGYAGLEYATNVNDTFGIEYQYVDISFRQSPVGAAQASNYREDTGRGVFRHAFSDKTSVSGYVGYLKRNYTGLNVGAFSGDIWRATFDWQATDKTLLAVSVYHELHAYLDAESDYFVAKGESIGPIWNATDKLSLSVLASHEQQNYIGSISSFVVAGVRTASVNTEQATVRYVPRDAWVVNVFFRHQKRLSNQASFAFADNLVSASITYRFW